LGIDPVKPEDAELCGDDAVCDVEPLAGLKDSKRPALVIGLYGFADHGESPSERFMRYKAAPFWEVQRKASAVIEAVASKNCCPQPIDGRD
jgi:hypothetical protein